MEDKIYQNKRLDEWLKEQDRSSFPGGFDYVEKLDKMSKYLEKEVYPEVEKGAMWSGIRSGEDPIYLNDHGKPHIDQVISRMTELLRVSQCELTPYEAYVLLAAVYFHDVGNVYGRKGHEKKCKDIMGYLGKLAGDDDIEKRAILQIAAAHGGSINGNKDTIGELEVESTLLRKIIRKQFLAALLRFADELSDDRIRASRFLLNNNLLEGSEVYHAYSQSLHSVMIEQDITLHFEMSREAALRQYRKGDESVYLLDEIFNRTLKMHLERVYCMRFLRTQLNIDRIGVTIEVFEDFPQYDPIGGSLETIFYTLEETGYPAAPVGGIQELCPELKWTGETLKEKLS